MKNAVLILGALLLLAEGNPLPATAQTAAEKPEPQIFLQEILPNPAGRDSGREWVKIINNSPDTASLANWTIISGKSLIKLEGEISGSSTKQIFIKKGSILNKNGSMTLKKPDDSIQEEVSYGTAKDDAVYKKQPDGSWQWDGPEIAKESATKSTTPSAQKSASKSAKTKKTTTKNKSSNGNLSNEIKITEILPNPAGSDSGHEWIELLNNDNHDIALSNWKIKTNNKTLTLSSNLIIKARNYITIPVVLTNTGGNVQLRDFQNNLISEISYEKAPEGLSYAEIEISEPEIANEPPTMESKIVEKIWDYTDEITPFAPNPQYQRFSGFIEKPPSAGSFTVTTGSGPFEILYPTLGPALAKLTLTPKTEVEVIAKKITETVFEFKKIQIIAQAPPPAQKTKYKKSIFFLAGLILILGLYKWKLIYDFISRPSARKITSH